MFAVMNMFAIVGYDTTLNSIGTVTDWQRAYKLSPDNIHLQH